MKKKEKKLEILETLEKIGRIGKLKLSELSTLKWENNLSFFEMLTPAVAGGIIIGIILGVPIMNFFLPLVPIGGWFAGKLVNDFYEKKISRNEGIRLGIFAGLVGAFIATLVNIIATFVYSSRASAFVNSIVDYKMSYVLLQLTGLDPYVTLEALGVRFIANLILGVTLGAIGGVIYFKFSQTDKTTRK